MPIPKGTVRNMLLAIDVGNTQTVLGIYDGDKLVHMWRLATNVDHTSDELRIKLRVLMQAEGLENSHIDGAILASVVPALTHNWEKTCYRSFCVKAVVVSVATAGHLINIDASKFPELGSDRVADAAAAKRIYGAPVVVVDFGTATNIEIVDKNGTFVGGIIAPGVESSVRSLFTRAALLRSVELEDPGTAIGSSTAECLKVGVVYGEAARVDGLVDRVFEQLGYEAPVVATGGLAHRIAPISKRITEINLELTLEGLRMIHEELSH